MSRMEPSGALGRGFPGRAEPSAELCHSALSVLGSWKPSPAWVGDRLPAVGPGELGAVLPCCASRETSWSLSLEPWGCWAVLLCMEGRAGALLTGRNEAKLLDYAARFYTKLCSGGYHHQYECAALG